MVELIDAPKALREIFQNPEDFFQILEERWSSSTVFFRMLERAGEEVVSCEGGLLRRLLSSGKSRIRAALGNPQARGVQVGAKGDAEEEEEKEEEESLLLREAQRRLLLARIRVVAEPVLRERSRALMVD